MKSWPLIFVLAISCGPTAMQKTGSQGVIPGSNLISKITLQTNSPSSISTPSFLIQGNFLIGNTVTLFSDSSCSLPIGQAVAQNNYSVMVTALPLGNDGTYNVYANISSRLSGSSGCSSAYATYEYETGASPPKVSVLTPSGPNMTPIVSVKDIQLGASIQIFSNSSCTGIPLASQNYIDSSFIQLNAFLPASSTDGPYQFWALQSLNENSICSAPSNVYSLNTKPGYVQVLNPSPGVTLKPTIRVGNGDISSGALVPGSLIKIFSDPSCSSPILGQKQAGPEEVSVDILLTSELPMDGEYKFYANQAFCPPNTNCPTSSNYRISPCSLVFGTYKLDTSPTIALNSASPSMNPFPEFKISGMVPAWRADVFLGSDCSGSSYGSAISNGQEVFVKLTTALPSLSGTYYFSAKQSKIGLRNGRSISTFESSCSNNFVSYDFEAPKVFISSPNPGNLISPTISVSELSSSATNTVSIYPSLDCQGTIVASTSTLGRFSASLIIPSTFLPSDGTYSFSAKQSAGNNNCLGYTSYILDTKPNNFKYVNPPSNKGNNPTPTFSVSNIANYATPTVTLHQLSDCSDTPAASATGISPSINLTLGSSVLSSEGLKTFYAKQTIPGHTPKCSTDNINYTYDITPNQISIVGAISGSNPSPLIQVGGLTSSSTGTVQIWRGSISCEVLMGSAPSPATGTILNILSDPLPTYIQGPVNYYAKQIINGVTSSCSIASATYNMDSFLSSILILTSSGPQQTASGSSNIPNIQATGFANGSVVKIYSDPNCSSTTLLGSASIPSTNTAAFVTIPSNPLNMEGANYFYGKQIIGTYEGPCSGTKNIFATYNLDSKPTAPILLTASPGTTLTPSVRAENIIPGALVELFRDDKCSQVIGSKYSTSTQVDLTISASYPLPVDGTYYFYIRQINNGHISPCSSSSSAYVLNTSPSGISVISTPYELLPEPKWNIPNPIISVSGVIPGANVVLYRDENCTQVIGNTISSSTIANITVTDGAFPSDGKYPLYTRQSYGGHTSFCSGNSNPIITSDYNLVTRPTINLSTPSPNNILKPIVNMMNTVTGAFLQLYSTPACDSGSEISGVYISTGGNQSLKVDEGLTINGPNKIYGRQVLFLSHGGLQSSPCSEAVNYTLSTNPQISLSTPSPSSVNPPSFTLSNLFSESDIGTKTVAIYSDQGCTFQVSSNVLITSSSMTVAINPITRLGLSTYYAKQNASNPSFNSPCSTTGASYFYELSPNLSMVTSSPNDILTPTLKLANIVTGATVTLFNDPQCSNAIQSTVATSTAFDWTLNSALPADGSYKFYANQEFGANISECSSSLARYELNTANFSIQPASTGGTSTTPLINISSINPGDTITLFADGACSQLISAPTTAVGTSVAITSFPISTYLVNHQWWAKREIGGFTSPCAGPSGTYVLNIMPSSISVITPSPGTSLTPVFQVGGVNNSSVVTLYSNGSCSTGYEIGSNTTGPSSTSVNVTVSQPMEQDGVLTVWARQLSNGSLSPCSTASASYLLNTRPTSLGLASTGSSSAIPIISVSGVEPGATVKIYVNDPNCSSSVMGLNTVANNATSTNVTSYPLSSDGNYHYYAKQFYPNSNFVSGCSTSNVLYNLSSAPTGLKLLSTNPTSSPAPKILVEGVSSGDWVYLFQDSHCNFASGSNIALGTSVEIQTLPVLIASDTYSFYAKRIQGGGQGLQSSCSLASVDLNFNPLFFSKWQLNREISKSPPAAGDEFGVAVATINNYAVVGVPGINSVYLYFYNGFSWEAAGALTNPTLVTGDHYGYAVDLYSNTGNISDGDLLIVGAPGPNDNSRVGRAFVYTFSNGSWGNEREFIPTALFLGANFGASVAVNSNIALIGAPRANSNNGTVRYFSGINGNFTSESIINPPAVANPGSQFGFSVAVYGNNLAISAPMGTGNQIVQYYTSSGTPNPGPYLTSNISGAEFGYSLDLSENALIIGSPGNSIGAGSAYVYSYSVSPIGVLSTSLTATLTAPPNALRFGESVALSSDTLGLVGQASSSGTLNGQAYIYSGPSFSNSTRTALPKIINSANDQFGVSVNISGGSIIIGAPGLGPGSSAGASFLYRND